MPKMFCGKSASVADAAAVNPNSIEKLLANGLSIFFIKGKPILSNGLEHPLTVLFYTIWFSIIF